MTGKYLSIVAHFRALAAGKQKKDERQQAVIDRWDRTVDRDKYDDTNISMTTMKWGGLGRRLRRLRRTAIDEPHTGSGGGLGGFGRSKEWNEVPRRWTSASSGGGATTLTMISMSPQATGSFPSIFDPIFDAHQAMPRLRTWLRLQLTATTTQMAGIDACGETAKRYFNDYNDY